jgi:hypothetical protein
MRSTCIRKGRAITCHVRREKEEVHKTLMSLTRHISLGLYPIKTENYIHYILIILLILPSFRYLRRNYSQTFHTKLGASNFMWKLLATLPKLTFHSRFASTSLCAWHGARPPHCQLFPSKEAGCVARMSSRWHHHFIGIIIQIEESPLRSLAPLGRQAKP